MNMEQSPLFRDAEIGLLMRRLQRSKNVPRMMEGVVRDRPRDVFEKHLAAFAMDDNDSLTRHTVDARHPVAAGTTDRPNRSSERHIGIGAGRSKEVVVIGCNFCCTCSRTGEALCPDAQIVSDVAYVGPHRPGEVRVAFDASCIYQQRRVFLWNPSDVRERVVETRRERKRALSARVSVHRTCPSVHSRTIADRNAGVESASRLGGYPDGAKVLTTPLAPRCASVG